MVNLGFWQLRRARAGARPRTPGRGPLDQPVAAVDGSHPPAPMPPRSTGPASGGRGHRRVRRRRDRRRAQPQPGRAGRRSGSSPPSVAAASRWASSVASSAWPRQLDSPAGTRRVGRSRSPAWPWTRPLGGTACKDLDESLADRGRAPAAGWRPCVRPDRRRRYRRGETATGPEPRRRPTPPPTGLVILPAEELSEGPHLGYAVQWFIFSTIALVGYPTPRRVEDRAGPGPTTPACDGASRR